MNRTRCILAKSLWRRQNNSYIFFKCSKFEDESLHAVLWDQGRRAFTPTRIFEKFLEERRHMNSTVEEQIGISPVVRGITDTP